jgi:hypothetical protein
VHAIGRNDVLRFDHVAVVQCHLGTIRVLPDTGGDAGPVDSASELLQPVQQDLLGDVLRHHQRVRILRLKTVEPDRHELAIAIADAELRSVDAKSC